MMNFQILARLSLRYVRSARASCIYLQRGLEDSKATIRQPNINYRLRQQAFMHRARQRPFTYKKASPEANEMAAHA
eukprot:1144330-Pelagomonas_calceolata.AAC.2